ncbi:MAG: UvrB/UvrC motif-containing protein [Patescibacteria group bacterium]|jgi:hypothetical protein|nr:UvrB/UvrC motif-containing protein [Patescibacteria group bacterium]
MNNFMHWANFLHFYQPYNQQKDILERIVEESYRKILKGLLLNKKAKLTININAGLTETLFKNGYQDVIKQIEMLAKRGQVQFTGGVKYHPFLPLLPKEEIKRQIELNNRTNKKYFGDAWQPQGFFSPELAYSKRVAQTAKEAGFGWIIAEELAAPTKPDFKKIYSIKDLNDFKIIFRDKRISVLILSAIVRHFESFIQEAGKEEIKKDRYLLTVMDAETFGHHRPGLEEFLFSIYKNKKIPQVFVSDLIEKFGVSEIIEPRDSTWSSEEQDFWLDKKKEHSFTLWSHPQNPIHQFQWKFTYFVFGLINKIDHQISGYEKIRDKMDKAIQSDQYWWASAKPWWSLEMIEQGAHALKQVVFSIPNVSLKIREQAENYYQQIIGIAFDWQRSGKIRRAYRRAMKTWKSVPYKKRVLAGQFNSMILEFEDEMKKAVVSQEFEKAIKWRDAIYKLKSGMDVHDVLHVVDDLRQVRQLPSLKDYWEHAPEEFSFFAQKHFIDWQKNNFIKKQPKQLFEEIKKTLKNQNQSERPLGFSWDKDDNFYFCEIPSKEIEYCLGEHGWDEMSLMKFSRTEIYHQPGQCFYHHRRGKVKIIVKNQSLVFKILRLLEKDIFHQSADLSVLVESKDWRQVFFKKNNRGEKTTIISYKKSKPGFKFKISRQRKK